MFLYGQMILQTAPFDAISNLNVRFFLYILVIKKWYIHTGNIGTNIQYLLKVLVSVKYGQVMVYNMEWCTIHAHLVKFNNTIQQLVSKTSLIDLNYNKLHKLHSHRLKCRSTFPFCVFYYLLKYLYFQGLDATKDDWDKTMSVNVAGFSHMAQACYAEMKKISLTENCSILNISSISAHQTQPDR